MYCKSCGKLIDNDSKYCIHCGTKLSLKKETGVEKTVEKKSLLDSGIETKDKIEDKIILRTMYDEDYKKETDATIFGGLLLLAQILIYLFGPTTFTRQDYTTYLSIYYVIALFFRIIISVWVVKIAKRQNRNSTLWGIFAFFIPSIALIIIGQTKKIFNEKFTNISRDAVDNISELHNSIIKEKKKIFSGENENIINLIESIFIDKNAFFANCEIYKNRYSKDIIEHLISISSSYGIINYYMSPFMKLGVCENTYPYKLLLAKEES